MTYSQHPLWQSDRQRVLAARPFLSHHLLPLGDDAGLSAQLFQVDVVLYDAAVRTLQPIGAATGEHLVVGPTLVKLPAIRSARLMRAITRRSVIGFIVLPHKGHRNASPFHGRIDGRRET